MDYLTSFAQHYICDIHTCYCMQQQCTFSALEFSIIGIYHNLFIHSTINGPLGSFHFGGINNKTAMNILTCLFVSMCS